MEKFKETKLVNVLTYTGSGCMILFMLSLILATINQMFIIGFLFIPLAGLFIIPAKILSKRDKYTGTLLDYFKVKLLKVKSIDDLYKIREEFESLATEQSGNKTFYCLSFPVDIKKLHQQK